MSLQKTSKTMWNRLNKPWDYIQSTCVVRYSLDGNRAHYRKVFEISILQTFRKFLASTSRIVAPWIDRRYHSKNNKMTKIVWKWVISNSFRISPKRFLDLQRPLIAGNFKMRFYKPNRFRTPSDRFEYPFTYLNPGATTWNGCATSILAPDIRYSKNDKNYKK